MNRIATLFLRIEDVDVKETALYLLQFIFQLDRRSFEKQEVEKCMKEVGTCCCSSCVGIAFSSGVREGRGYAERTEGVREDD